MFDIIIAFFRIIIGLALVLFVPGYLFQRMLFENKNELLEQIALSIGLSICLNVLSIMAMNLWFKIPITMWTILGDIIIVCAIILVAWAIKKKIGPINIDFGKAFQKESLPQRDYGLVQKKGFSLNKLQILSIVLLIGAFLYFFELFSHGYEQQDISGLNIMLTFLAFILFAALLFSIQYFKGRIKNVEIIEFASFFIFAIAFFYLIFFTRTVDSIVSFVIAFAYFGIVLAMIFSKGNAISDFIQNRYNLNNPFIRFSFRFFLVLGILIFPAGIIEFLLTGQIDFRFHGISMVLIQIITPPVQAILALLGISSTVAQVEGGLTLTTIAPKHYQVFIGLLCSGITSMSVFLAAFVAMAWDLKTTQRRKIIILGIGVFGTVFSNVLRVVTLILVGLYFGNDAMIMMHTNLGWILYFVWMTVFWAIAFKIAK